MTRQLFDTRRLHSSGFRRRFLTVLFLAFMPLLVISLLLNLRLIRVQQDNAERVIDSIASQASDAVGSSFRTVYNLGQALSINTLLQKDVLPSGTQHSWSQINRNILSLQAMIKNYLFIDDIAGIRFYLPPSLVVPNGEDFFSMESAADEPWYADFLAAHAERRLYPAPDGKGGGALCFVQPLLDPLDYREIKGYMRIDLSLPRIREQLESCTIYDGTVCLLLDAAWRPILACPDDGALDPSLLPLPSVAGDGTGDVVLEGVHCLYNLQAVEGSDMLLLCLVPRRSIISAVLTNCLAQLVLLLVDVVLLVVIMALFAYSLMYARDNQLKLLNYQINPHFLYNTLDMINWQAIDQGVPEIYRPIQALSRFYKLALNHGLDYIRVGDELEQLRLYLELQNCRFTNSIEYRFDVDESLNDCRILHMVLLPILENAILHGIREKDDHCGTILIRCAREGRNLCFTIRDDGIGMPPETVKQLLARGNSPGYGLANVQDRIRLCYGKRYGIEVESAFGRGTTVRVLLPAFTADAGKEPPFSRFSAS